jgi:hypothetical protein
MEDLARRFFELDPTRESLYWNVAMRGASHSMLGVKTMDGPGQSAQPRLLTHRRLTPPGNRDELLVPQPADVNAPERIS